MTFIGTGQTVTVAESGNKAGYELNGQEGPEYSATAHLVASNAWAFHGPITLEGWSDVYLSHVWASSYTFDAKHDLLKLYQGEQVVDTIKLHVPGATGTNAPLFMQSNHDPFTQDGWTYFGTGNHGLSFGVLQHVAPSA
jgi:hypothetical protein